MNQAVSTMIYVIAVSGILLILPAFLLGLVPKEATLFEKLSIAMSINCFVVIMLVFLLAFLNILNVFTLLAGILLLILCCLFIFKRENTMRKLDSMLRIFAQFTQGFYSGKIIWRRFFSALTKGIGRFFIFIFRNIVDVLVFCGVFGYAIWYRCYHALTQLQYGVPDGYVHTMWVKMLEQGEIFTNGVYPFGMHNIIYAVKALFGLNMVTLMRDFGVFVGLIVVIMLYLFLRTVFRSKTAANLAFIFYCLCDAIIVEAVKRQMYTIPQELGMIFIFPCGYFFNKYLNQRQTRDLIIFSLCFSLTLLIHFYLTIIAGIICACILLVNIHNLFKRGVFLRLLLAGVISVVVAFLPLGVGLMSGLQWEKSMTYATDVIEGTAETSAGSNAIADEYFSGQISFREAFEHSINDFFPIKWFWYLMAATLLSCIYFIWMLFYKDERERIRIIFSMVLFVGIIVFISIAPIFGLPLLMELNRSCAFFAYGCVVVLAVPVDMIAFILRKKTWTRAAFGVVAAALYLSFAYYLFGMGRYMRLGYSFQMQYKGCVQAYYQIVSQMPQDNWTIVSPTEETCMVIGDGYHYELRDFIIEMEDYSEKSKIYIPTTNVFVYVEKSPLDFNRHLFYSQPLPEDTPMVTWEEAQKPIELPPDATLGYPYVEHSMRRIIESKAYYWAQKYREYFPNEMRVFYEDEQIVVYHIVQNINMPNNFAINYGGNVHAAPQLSPPEEDMSEESDLENVF